MIISGIIILIGGTLMRFAWLVINEPFSPAIIIGGAVLFLGGVIYLVNQLFNFRR